MHSADGAQPIAHCAALGSWRRLSRAQLPLVSYYALYVFWYFASGSTGHVRTFVSDVAYLPLGVAGLVLSLRAARRASSRRDRTVWLLIALALAFRAWGEGAWWWLEAIRDQSPFPSVADVGYFGFYPVLIIAVAALPTRPQSRRASVGDLLDVLAMVGGAFVVIWYLVLGAALQGGVGNLEQALNVAYPVWDLLQEHHRPVARAGCSHGRRRSRGPDHLRRARRFRLRHRAGLSPGPAHARCPARPLARAAHHLGPGELFLMAGERGVHLQGLDAAAGSCQRTPGR